MEEDLGEEEEDGSYAESEEDRERSLRGHTGGKWKPELDDLPQNMSQLQDEDEDEQHQEHPPPSHTGGKWRPSDASHVRNRSARLFSKRLPFSPSPAAFRRRRSTGPRAATWGSNHRRGTREGNGSRARGRTSSRRATGATLAAGNSPPDRCTTGISAPTCTPGGASERWTAPFACRAPPAPRRNLATK